MGVLDGARSAFHLGRRPAAMPDYRSRMRAALEKVRLAELQIAQAGSIEELDLGRAAMQQAYAEVQHLIRAAKRELGLPLRPVGETETLHRQLIETMSGRRAIPPAGEEP